MIAFGGVLDRAGAERDDPELLGRLRVDAGTRFLVIQQGRAAATDDGIALMPASALPAAMREGAQEGFLGRLEDGTAVILIVPAPEITTDWHPVWGGVRERMPMLDAEGAEILMTGVALAGWMTDHAHCPRCGGRAPLRQAGWSRRCGTCNRDVFPRTDPAVIVAVESADGQRLLLGANANWQGRMYSCFAGFVEAGESLETTVHREILEEAGVRLRDVRYRSSQPWPYPHSLMLGFRATAVDEDAAQGDGEEILDARWFTRDEIGSALAGDGPVGLPSAASIAHGLIVDWYEERG